MSETHLTIKEQPLESFPEMYDSPANNPFIEVVGKNRSVYSDFTILRTFFDHTLTVPEATGSGPGRTTAQGSYTPVTGGFIFPVVQLKTTTQGAFSGEFSEAPFADPSVLITNGIKEDNNYTVEAYNYNSGLGVRTFTIRVYIYEISLK